MDAPTTMVEAIDVLDDTERGLTFYDTGRFLPYRELRTLTRDMGRRLASGFGLAKGDRAIVVLPSEEEFAQVYLGCLWAGVVAVPMYPPFIFGQMEGYQSNLQRICAQSGARYVITSPEVRDLLDPERFPAPFLTFAEIMDAAPEGDLPPIGPDDTAFLQYTSGSTADPKGVVVSHRALVANARAIAAHLRITPDDRGVSWLPLYHDMGLIGFLITPLLSGCSTWLMPPLKFAARPSAWCQLINDVRGTISFAPNFAYSLLARRVTDRELGSWDLSCWRVAGCGAEPIRIDDLRSCAERLAVAGFDERAFAPSYGMAEMTLAIAIAPLDEPPRALHVERVPLETEHTVAVADAGDETAIRIVSCGEPLTGFDIRIGDRLGDNNDVGQDREGEILVRGPSLTGGYFNDAVNTERTFHDGWVHTGDLGFLHDGELYITGRSKDLIILNGRNYHPQDIEMAVCEEPGVRRGNAIAFSVVKDGTEGAVVVFERTGTVDGAELARRVARRVAKEVGIVLTAAIPLERDALLKTSSGKLRRAAVREQYLNGELPVPTA